jgi:hypothetical protein
LVGRWPGVRPQYRPREQLGASQPKIHAATLRQISAPCRAAHAPSSKTGGQPPHSQRAAVGAIWSVTASAEGLIPSLLDENPKPSLRGAIRLAHRGDRHDDAYGLDHAALAELERSIIRERTRAGLASARARGTQRRPAEEAQRSRVACHPHACGRSRAYGRRDRLAIWREPGDDLPPALVAR